MKLNFLKSTLKFMVMALIASTIMVSCDDDDDGDEEDPVIVLDGLYLKVDGATDADLVSAVKFDMAKNEVLQEDRTTLYELYMTLEAGSAGFNIVKVAGSSIVSYGPSSDFAMVDAADLDVEEPTAGLWKGGIEETSSMFTVPENGLYHIVVDTELGKMAIAKVVWGVIGGATPGGWSASTPMTATYNADKMVFSVENVTMLENEWKFRYSDGWKIILDAEYDLGDGNKGVKVNCNFGGTLDELEAGGGNISNAEYAVYTIELTWEKGVGTSATIVKTGEAEPLPEYPEKLYMIGGALNLNDSDSDGTPDGWQWDLTDVEMIPVHSHANAFWRIVWLEASEGLKFAPAREWAGDFGIDDDTKPGVGDHLKGSSNVPAPTEAGYYMVWVDLERDSISVTTPEVYLLGDAVGSWDVASMDNKFMVDNANKKLTITKDLEAGNLRIHAWHKWHYDWWQHEFMVINSNIEYRGTGDDQEAVPVTEGNHTVTLDFTTGTGSIQ